MCGTDQSTMRTSAFKYLLQTRRVSMARMHCRLRNVTYSAMSMDQIPVPQPKSRMRGSTRDIGA